MFFRKPYTVTRTGPGSYVAGQWVNGPESTLTAAMGVQPATSSDYDMLQATADGRRIERAVRIYTGVRLQAAGEGQAARGDRFQFEGATYEVSAVSPWRSTPLRHYRYLATKVLEA